MLKFTSVSDSAQGIMGGIILTVTTIRTGIIIDLITGRIIGSADTAITGITIPIIIDAD